MAMASQFSKNGAYFAHLSADGKLHVWNTSSGIQEQEFVPDFHLTSPCTCLHFVERKPSVKNGSPRKKMKRRNSQDLCSTCVALGTANGSLLMYSLSKAEMDYKIKSDLNQSVSCLSWFDGDILYSGTEQSVVVWDLNNRSVKRKWKAGNERITAILAVPQGNKLLTASKNIKLWDISKTEVLLTFTGHSTEVSVLYYINPGENGHSYFVSAAKGDRILNCWNLDSSISDRNAVAAFLMEDACNSLSIIVGPDGSTSMGTVTKSGVAHIYRHTLNGKCSKPLKPKTSVQVVSDTGQSERTPVPIPILNMFFIEDSTLRLAYGNSAILTFENMTLNKYGKLQCLIRKDTSSTTASLKTNKVSKNCMPIIDGSVQYLTPYTSTTKRKSEGKIEIPMEKRLENLQLKKFNRTSAVPKADNVAQLLVQGLHSNDQNIIKTVLGNKDENVINNSVKRLPMPVIAPLMKELTRLIRGKTVLSQVGVLWLGSLLKMHAGLLLSNPDLSTLVGPLLGSIETRLTLQVPVSKLKGRLDLLLSQVSRIATPEDNMEPALLVFNDKAVSNLDVDIMEITAHSDSDHEWIEESSESENNFQEQEESDYVEMSV